MISLRLGFTTATTESMIYTTTPDVGSMQNGHQESHSAYWAFFLELESFGHTILVKNMAAAVQGAPTLLVVKACACLTYGTFNGVLHAHRSFVSVALCHEVLGEFAGRATELSILHEWVSIGIILSG